MRWALVVLGVIGAPAPAMAATDPFAVTLRAAGPGKASASEDVEAAARARVAADTAARRWGEAVGQDAEAAAQRCVVAHVAVYNEHSTLDAVGDELLFNAGTCAAGHAPGVAIQLWRALIERYPRGRLAPAASLALGRVEAAIGSYADAATDLERYARLAPKEKSARDALQEALAYRMGLGQRAQARVDWEALLRLYGAKDPAWAAEVHMAGWALARDDAERLKFVEAYLRRYARSGGEDRTIIAMVEAGRLLWQRSCKRRGTDGPPGLCVTGWAGTWPTSEVQASAGPAEVTVRRGGDRVCAAALPWDFEVHARDERLAAAGQAYFVQAQRLVRAGKAGTVADGPRIVALRVAEMEARRFMADAEMEALMAMRPPALWFGPRPATDAAQQRERAAMMAFQEFYARLTAQAWEVHKRILGADFPGEPRIVVEGRVAALYRALAARLLATPLHGLSAEAAAASCEMLTGRVEALAAESRRALATCVEHASATGLFTPAARACEAELERRAPATLPRLAEFVPAVGRADWEPASESVVLEAPATRIDGAAAPDQAPGGDGGGGAGGSPRTAWSEG